MAHSSKKLEESETILKKKATYLTPNSNSAMGFLEILTLQAKIHLQLERLY